MIGYQQYQIGSRMRGHIMVILLIALLGGGVASAQKEYNIWYFGSGSGIDFNSTPPVALTNGKMGVNGEVMEGCASICNPATGGLLFYTNGVDVWNRNHQLMPNGTGLKGHKSTTQSVAIAPFPGDATLYYVITADAYESPAHDGINYSIVDMGMNGGLGDVAVKNTLLKKPATEKLCVVRHCNQRDYWIIAHGSDDDRFYVWELSSAGISGPVISRVGSVLANYNTIGYLKASPNGRMLASALHNTSTIELFHFDNATGIVLDPILLPGAPNAYSHSYGASFSPSGTLLYATQSVAGAAGGPAVVGLFQYRVDLYDQASIIASRRVIQTAQVGTTWGAMQIAADKKIYIAKAGVTPSKISSIDAPNVYGTGCGYRDNAFTIPCNFGLPNLIDSYLDTQKVAPPVTREITICRGDTTTVSAGADPSLTYRWSPAAGLSCTSCRSARVSPDTSTVYLIEVSDLAMCTRTDTLKVTVLERPAVDAGPRQSICRGDSAMLTGSDAVGWNWQPAAGLSCTTCRNPVARPDTTTLYTLTITSQTGCRVSDTVRVVVVDPPVVDAGATLRLCRGDSVMLTATGAAGYHWSPAAGLSCTDCPQPFASPAFTTTYTVTGVSDSGCTATDTVQVIVSTRPDADAGPTQQICRGGSTTLHASGGGHYRWSPIDGLSCFGCAEPLAYPAVTTLYTLTVTSDSGCVVTDTVTVFVLDSFALDIGAAQTICHGDSVVLKADGGSKWQWIPAEGLSCTDCREPVASPSSTTRYTLTAENDAGCRATDTITVTVLPVPPLDAGADVTICEGASTQLHATGATSYSWKPGAGLSCTDCPDPKAEPSATTLYYVTTTAENGCSVTDSVRVTVIGAGSVDAGIAQTICGGDSVHLQASDGAAWQWSPPTGLSCTDCRSPIAHPSATTLYTVTVSAAGCSASDTVTVTVLDLPVISAGPDVSICPGGTAQLHASGGSSYQWSPAEGLSCTDCADPIASPTATTVYHVTSAGANGCRGEGRVRVEVGGAQVVHGHIGRDYRVYPGAPRRIPVVLDDAITAPGIDTMEIDLSYGPGILRLNGVDLTDGILSGWNLEPLNVTLGNYRARLIAPAGAEARGNGILLTLDMSAYLGDSLGSELPMAVELTGSECQRVEIAPGRVVLDSVCGLSYRLVRISADKYSLSQNDPNPFNPTTRIAFSLAFDGPARLEVFDAVGTRVAVLIEEAMAAGSYEAVWDAGNAASGVYYYRLTSGTWSATRRMVVAK
jgi:hypothetical protein